MLEFDWITASIGLVFIIMIWFIFRSRVILGKKHWNSMVKAAFFRFKKPINAYSLHKTSFLEIEIREADSINQFGSEADNSPISVEESARYNGEGEYKNYFFAEGMVSNFDPLKTNEKLYQILKRIGLLNDKYLDYKEKRIRRNLASNILTVEHFNKTAIIGGVVLVVIVYLLFNMFEFTNSVAQLYTEWIPIIEQQFDNVPKLVPADGGSLIPDDILGTINNPK
jgi:hypothetical protein